MTSGGQTPAPARRTGPTQTVVEHLQSLDPGVETYALQVAKACQLENPTVVRILRRLASTEIGWCTSRRESDRARHAEGRSMARRYYRLTDAGRAAVEEWLSQ